MRFRKQKRPERILTSFNDPQSGEVVPRFFTLAELEEMVKDPEKRKLIEGFRHPETGAMHYPNNPQGYETYTPGKKEPELLESENVELKSPGGWLGFIRRERY